MRTDMQVLSINPSWYGVNRVAEKMIQLENEKLAELVAQYLWRLFRCSAHGADQKEGVNKHNLRGVAIGGHVNGDERSNPKFDPCWKRTRSWIAWFLCTRRVFRKMNQRGGQRRG
jgi:hypothetical protein